MEKLQYIHDMSWRDVFELWSQNESSLPHWIEHYKNRGFSSWEEWREDSTKDLHPETLSWKLFKLSNLGAISEFYGGPFRSWKKKYYKEEKILQFHQIAQNLELQNDTRIQSLITNFPHDSTLIGLVKDGKIIIIDGMHRASTVAVASAQNISLKSNFHIALAEFKDELPLLGQESSPV